MNIYAASVALLWTTAMQASTVYHVRPREQLPLPSAGCAAAGRPQAHGPRWLNWRRVPRG